MSEQKALSRRDMLNVLASAMVSRLGYSGNAGNIGKTFGGNRDLYTVLGYDKQPDFDRYLGMYEREDIASRLIKYPASETWKAPPDVKDGADEATAKSNTQFVEDWQALVKRLKVWHFLNRADRLAGIGRFGVLLLGTGSGELQQPATGKQKLLYLQPFHEGSVSVQKLDENTKSPRFGLPETYSIDFGTSAQDTASMSIGSKDVHWTRIIHVAESLDENSVYGEPRLQAVLNRLFDLQKTVGGSSEAVWLLANRGMQLDLRDGYGLDSDQETELENQVEEYIHGIRRVLQTAGIDINELGGSTIDPSGIVRIILMLIAGTKEIPLRILVGSERGELASSQDQVNWAGTIRARQEQYAEPVILRPFVDWCIAHSVIAAPNSGEYYVDWPSIYDPSDQDKAAILRDQLAAVQSVGSTVGAVVTADEVRTQIPWVEGDLPETEDEPETTPDQDLSDTSGETGEDMDDLETPDEDNPDQELEAEERHQLLHKHNHEYTIESMTCPLCGHGKVRKYGEEHGALRLCDRCLQTFDSEIEHAI